MRRLTLITHAETAALRDARFPSDESLSLEGHRNACALKGCLASADLMLTSPAAAARETAAAAGLAAELDPALRDMDLGRWAGRPAAEILREAPDAATAWRNDPGFAGHGGEPIAAVIERVAAWLDAQSGRDHRSVIAFSHAAVLRAAVVALLAAPPLAFWQIEAEPLAALRLSHDGRRWTIRAIGPALAAPKASPASQASD